MEIFTLELTQKQQDGYAWLAGVRRSTLTVPRLRLGALVLAAAAAGRDVLPLSSSPSMIHCMLHPDSLPDDVSKPFVVCLPLTAEQSEQIRQLTGKYLRVVAIAPAEWPVDYIEQWQPGEPFQIGHTITVLPDGADESAVNGNHPVRLPLSVDGVFGTGRHPATGTAMLLIEDYLRKGHRMFDIGTGSGIFAIAAVRLGAREVLAVDVEPSAVAYARQAVALNGVSDQVQVELGSIEVGQSEYDLVVMNIFPDVILRLAPQLERVLGPDGMVITSGAVRARAPELTKGMAHHGLEQVDERIIGNWIGQLFRRSVT